MEGYGLLTVRLCGVHGGECRAKRDLTECYYDI
jgi:hypothetical protein